MSSNPPPQSEQYNTITTSYTALYPPDGNAPSSFPIAKVEETQLRLAATDPTLNGGVKGKRVLELACGNGYYTTKLLSWGAASVTGIDISSGMLETAKSYAREQEYLGSKAKFFLCDATNEKIEIEGGPFDVVTSCWLLNYAPNSEVMSKMFSTIARHLKPGGYSINLTSPPLLTGSKAEGEFLQLLFNDDGAWGMHGCRGTVLEAMPNNSGFRTRVELGLLDKGHENFGFENYYMTLQTFQDGCEKSGMFEGLEWRDYVIPEEVKEGRSVGFWNEAALMPECRVCVARRKS